MVLFLCRYTKIREQKLKKLGTKNYLQEQKKNWEQNLQKFENKSYKNLGNKITKI
jgi:hypothetical protein